MSQRTQVILVPVDGSQGSDSAVRFAATLAEPLAVPLRLLFAFPKDALDMLGVPSEGTAADQLKSYSPEYIADLRDKRGGDVFERARQVISAGGVAVEETVLSGDPASAIIAYAKSIENPLIIMGSRGLSRISEMLMGSVSHRVIHHANCPVTVVPQ
ncbi:MAG: universal stress protein [Thiohalocapsa sp.]